MREGRIEGKHRELPVNAKKNHNKVALTKSVNNTSEGRAWGPPTQGGDRRPRSSVPIGDCTQKKEGGPMWGTCANTGGKLGSPIPVHRILQGVKTRWGG